MCSSKLKLQGSGSTTAAVDISPTVMPDDMNGRPVLQPAGNRVSILERRNSLMMKKKKKTTLPKSSSTPSLETMSSLLAPPSPSSSSTTTTVKPILTSSPISPKLKSPRPPAVKRGNDPNGLNSSVEKVLLTPKSSNTSNASTTIKPVAASSSVKKPKKSTNSTINSCSSRVDAMMSNCALQYPSSLIVEAPGSIAAARREQVAIMQVQRKMRIAHYGRSKSAKFESRVVSAPFDSLLTPPAPIVRLEDRRCSFITCNSDPVYVAYHDEEWGVPVHDDKLLFELLVLTGAQVGSDWTSVLKKRQAFRDAFTGYDAETVSKFNEKKIISISADYGIDLSQVRGVVDNAKRVLEVKKEFGSFDKYLWRFVNNKPIATEYKSSHRIPVKTSKSEAISKDMVRRGFRLVGPTVIHSFMQAAGLTNDHLITCPRHHHHHLHSSSPPQPPTTSTSSSSSSPPDDNDDDVLLLPVPQQAAVVVPSSSTASDLMKSPSITSPHKETPIINQPNSTMILV